VRPWSGEADPVPRNALSQRPYRGINVIVLGMAAHSHGYATNKWLTFKQALQVGGHVRQGERSSEIVYYELKAVTDEESEHRNIPMLKLFHVFNLDQIDGLPSEYRSAPVADPAWDASAVAEQIITARATILNQASVFQPGERPHLPAAAQHLR
jgi:antirestriction protein ArdC